MRKRITFFQAVAVGALIIVGVAVLSPTPAFAQGARQKVITILNRVLDIVFSIAIVIGVIYIVIAGIKYMSSGGSPEKVGEAHKALTWGIVGIAVALIAESVPLIVKSILE